MFREHPLSGRSDQARALPTGLHGDGAPVSAKGKNLAEKCRLPEFFLAHRKWSSQVAAHHHLSCLDSGLVFGCFVIFFLSGGGGAGRTNKCTLGSLQVAVSGRKLG